MKFLALQAKAIAAYLPPENFKHREQWDDSYVHSGESTRVLNLGARISRHHPQGHSGTDRRENAHSEPTQLAHPTCREHEIRANWRLQVAKNAYPYAHCNVRRVGCGHVRGERSMPCIACEQGHGFDYDYYDYDL